MKTTNAPKERPILFSGLMVRAILDGRKTQTRRIVTPQPSPFLRSETKAVVSLPDVDFYAVNRREQIASGALETARCRFGKPGDRLWVKETFALQDELPIYRADARDNLSAEVAAAHSEKGCWTPSIFMPRWASRITLEVVSVRVERLQDITEADAIAEGCFAIGDCDCTAAFQFQRLWESINGPESWSANPWVWVVEFRRI